MKGILWVWQPMAITLYVVSWKYEIEMEMVIFLEMRTVDLMRPYEFHLVSLKLLKKLLQDRKIIISICIIRVCATR